MIIRSLSVRNFRNIASADFIFDPKVNIFTGNNAQGKTNLCEAISVCFGKSFRNPKVSELLPFGTSDKETAIEMCFFFDNMNEKENVIQYTQKNSSFRLKFNGIEMKDAEKLYGALRYVLFIPEDLYIVKGDPSKRRDYIDFVSNMINRVHNYRLYEYNKALKQKNNILMNMSVYDTNAGIMLESWNETIAKLGVNVMCGRIKYFDMLSAAANEYYGQINGGNETLTMQYESSVMGERSFTADDFEIMYDIYMKRLRETADRELRMKYTVVGAHRDDVSFFINDMPAKDFASQGQIRSIAVALKLAEARMIKEKSDDVPIIILDDVLSELDEYRRGFIINHIDNFQVFITSCNLADTDKFGSGKIWNVHGGSFEVTEG
ncbi:MAG: DNA replication/repair protein RecF [Ruminiclostridium sp.]|nr:DNA replication/repair protein RecF [Ruminiclostridium sp.]